MTAIILMLANDHDDHDEQPGEPAPPSRLARLADLARDMGRRLYDQWRQHRLDAAADHRIRTGPPLTAADLDALPIGARITTTSGAYAVKIAAGRWATDMAAPLTATAASQDVASDGVTAMRIPLRPPAPMPWHTE